MAVIVNLKANRIFTVTLDTWTLKWNNGQNENAERKKKHGISKQSIQMSEMLPLQEMNGPIDVVKEHGKSMDLSSCRYFCVYVWVCVPCGDGNAVSCPFAARSECVALYTTIVYICVLTLKRQQPHNSIVNEPTLKAN